MPTDRNYGSLKSLPPDLKALHQRTYESALRLYSDKKFATGAAWRAVRLAQGEEPTPSRRRVRIPNPDGTIILGKLLEFAYMTDPPNIQFVKFKKGSEPDLLWSRKHKMLIAFPHAVVPAQRDRNVSAALTQEYVRWSQRAPRGAAQFEVPVSTIAPAGAADTVVYRSSKWTRTPGDPPGAQEYIHQFGPGVVYEKGSGRIPSTIVFRGGKLDVLPAGIVN